MLANFWVYRDEPLRNTGLLGLVHSLGKSAVVLSTP